MAPQRYVAAALGLTAALLAPGCGGAGDDSAAGAVPSAPPRLAPARLADLDPALAEAVAGALAAVEAEPADVEAWRGLAELYLANQLSGEAEAAFAGAVALAPVDAAAWYGRAFAAARDGRIDEARGFGARAAELDPGYAPTLWRIGEWCFGAGELDEARGWYTRASEADPTHPGGWLGLARVHLARDEHAQAAQVLEARVLRGPSDAYGRQLLARAFRGLGREEEARVLAAQGSRGAPMVPDPRLTAMLRREVGLRAQLARIDALLGAGRGADAEAILRPLVDARPDDASVVAKLAMALYLQGQIDACLTFAQRAEAMDPGSHYPVLIQGLASMRARDAAVRESALGLLRRAREMQPAASQVHNALGVLLLQRGDKPGALEAFRDGRAHDPDNIDLAKNVATIERQLGLLPDAEASYKRLLALVPGAPDALVGLGDVYLRLGDPGRALDSLGGALGVLEPTRGAFDPLTVDARKRYVQALEALGRTEEAAAERKRLP